METIAYKAFSAFDGIVIHSIEYGIDDKIIFSYQIDGKTVAAFTNARFATTQAENFISVLMGGVNI